MEESTQILERINAFLWSGPVLGMILGTGLRLSIRGGWPQLRLFPAAVRCFCRRMLEGGSSIRALCMALAATVGTGNIAGVACAISVGGPGAVFWIWVSGILGMGIKLCEGTLAVRFRSRGRNGEILAGPMYLIREGLPGKFHALAAAYAFFGLFAAFGVGNATQVQAIFASLEACAQSGVRISPLFRAAVGMGLALAVLWLVSGGVGTIGAGAQLLVPAAAIGYAVLCLSAIVQHREALLPALRAIFAGVWTPEAVTGGMVGSSLQTLRIGISRGIFTNEAGMGTAAMAHGTAEGVEPVEQGMMGLIEVFLDTLVICTLTALLILTSGVQIPYGTVSGAELTAGALTGSFGPWAAAALCGCISLFALATILGWGLYAGRCMEYLLGRMNWRLFALGQAACVGAGMVLRTGTVWGLADLMNGLMALPNMTALLMLCPEFLRLVNLRLEKDRQVCYNQTPLTENAIQEVTYHERKRNRRDPAPYPPGPQQYDRTLRLLCQRGRGNRLHIPSFHRHDAGK